MDTSLFKNPYTFSMIFIPTLFLIICGTLYVSSPNFIVTMDENGNLVISKTLVACYSLLFSLVLTFLGVFYTYKYRHNDLHFYSNGDIA